MDRFQDALTLHINVINHSSISKALTGRGCQTDAKSRAENISLKPVTDVSTIHH